MVYEEANEENGGIVDNGGVSPRRCIVSAVRISALATRRTVPAPMATATALLALPLVIELACRKHAIDIRIRCKIATIKIGMIKAALRGERRRAAC